MLIYIYYKIIKNFFNVIIYQLSKNQGTESIIKRCYNSLIFSTQKPFFLSGRNLYGFINHWLRYSH